MVSVNLQHPQLNGTKSVELEIVYARVHLLNEGGLHKMDQTKQKKLRAAVLLHHALTQMQYINTTGHQYAYQGAYWSSV